jgi:hypothetical protein
MRRFPAPWTVERIPGGFKVVDANGQSLAYVYSRENPNDANIAKVLTEDEARRIAATVLSAFSSSGRRFFFSPANSGTSFRIFSRRESSSTSLNSFFARSSSLAFRQYDLMKPPN